MRISDWSSDVCSSDLQTIGKTGIENDVPPARPGQELTIGPHLEADRSVHPAVHGENPGRRNKRAQGDHKGRCKMQLFSDVVHAEQHDPEKTLFEADRREKRSEEQTSEI